MKNYRMLLPIVLTVVLVLSFYKMIGSNTETESVYQGYLTEARKYAENGARKPAIENYELALDMREEPEVYAEVAAFYKAEGLMRDYIAWSKDFYDKFPKNPLAIDCMLDAFLGEKDYKSCFDILYVSQKRGIDTDFMQSVWKQLEYEFYLDYSSYTDVSIFSNNLCAVRGKNYWGYVNRYGTMRALCNYQDAKPYTNEELAPVVDKNGRPFFIDITDEIVLATKEDYTEFGEISSERFYAKAPDGKYRYLNKHFEILLGDYDYASTFNNNIAAVKNGSQWSLIDLDGKTITNTTYADVKLDEKHIAYRNNRAFVAEKEGQYIMVDENAKQVGKLVFEDAFVFPTEAPTAVKINGKWQFIDLDGKLISDKQYENARPFSNGLAAICDSGKWGFVDESETIVIEPQFANAKDFTAKGSCFVSTGDKWQLLKLYRLNRED